MQALAGVALVLLIQILLSSKVEGQTCDNVINDFRNVLPVLINNKDYVNVITVINTLTMRYRELDKREPVNDIDNSFNGVRNAMANAGLNYQEQMPFNNRYMDLRRKVLEDYDKCWFDIAAKAIRAVDSRDPASTDLEALFTTFRTDCLEADRAAAAALKTARDGMTQVALDVMAKMATTRSVLGAVFERGQFMLNSRLFDAVMPQCELVVTNDLQVNNFRMINTLRGFANSMIIRINLSQSSNKQANIAAVNDIFNKFAPLNTQRDVNTVLATLKPDADRAMDPMRTMMNPNDLRLAVVNFITGFAKKVDDAYTPVVSKINTDFLDSVRKILAIVP